MKNFNTLKNIHKNEDIWVLASGPSLNFISKDFFVNKITIGVNRVSNKIPCKYIVSKDARGVSELIENTNSEIILSKFDCGNYDHGPNKNYNNCYYFEHPSNVDEPNTDIVGGDKIVVSSSTITSAIHIAAFMGAKNIILVGHDCGTIDGKITLDNYYDKIKPVQGESQYKKFITHDIEKHTIKVCKKLKEVYNVNIHSLNPFINLGIEGHKYER
jgi:hypothetical protein